MTRWRLILGPDAEAETTSLSDAALTGMDDTLDLLYNEDRQGELGASSPRVHRWLGDVRKYFPGPVVHLIQRDAFAHIGLTDLLLEPELLANLEPDIHLAGILLEAFESLDEPRQAAARQIISQVADQLIQKVRLPLHQAIRAGLVQSCHDLSEGGLAVALAEMCLGGRLGAEIDTTGLKIEDWAHGDSGHGGASAQTNLQSSIFNLVLLFSESNGRLLMEVAPEDAAAFEACFGDGIALARIGEVTAAQHMTIRAGDQTLTQVSIESMLEAWKV